MRERAAVDSLDLPKKLAPNTLENEGSALHSHGQEPK